jgi:hypothetical protein
MCSYFNVRTACLDAECTFATNPSTRAVLAKHVSSSVSGVFVRLRSQARASKRVVAPVRRATAGRLRFASFADCKMLKRLACCGRLNNPLGRRSITIPSVTSSIAIPRRSQPLLVRCNGSGNVVRLDSKFVHTSPQIGNDAFTSSFVHSLTQAPERELSAWRRTSYVARITH